jgi:hypothetical protein
MKKIVKTTFNFPIVEIFCEVKYSQVEKPTGIAYILLMIIYSSKNRNDNFSSLLVSFGVPIDLHDIFAHELDRLISLKIIEFKPYSSYEFDYGKFNIYNVGNFLFTEFGKKIFNDKVIPLDKEIQTRINVFWNIARNELLLSQNELLAVDKSLIPLSIYDNNKYKDNDKLEDFLVQHRGKGIIIKSEEIITEVLPYHFENFGKYYHMDIDIENNNISFVFQDMSIESFFNKEYSSELIESTLKSKSIFKFKGIVHKKNIETPNSFELLIPEDMNKELKFQAYLDIYRSDYIPAWSSFLIQSSSILDFIDEDAEFVKIVNSETGYYYIPAEISLENNNFGSLLLPVLLKGKLSKTQIIDIVRNSLKVYAEYSKENIKAISSICQKFELNEELHDIILDYANKDNESNLLLLKEIKGLNVLSEVHLEYLRKLVKTNFELLINDIDEKNLVEKLEIVNWVPNFIKISEISFLEMIINAIKEKEFNIINVFEILEKASYDVKNILVFINPIPFYLKQGKANGPFGIMLLNFIDIHDEIKKIIGIKGIHDKLKDDFNREIFLTTYREFNKLYFQINEYEKYFNGYFEDIKSLFERTNDLNKTINDEKNAELNPASITTKFVSSKILNGDYRSAIINLSIKLESILKINYKLTGKLSEMIEEVFKNKIIDNQIYKELSNFRNIRNSFGAHYESKNTVVKADDLEKWNEIIFDLNKVKEDKKLK